MRLGIGVTGHRLDRLNSADIPALSEEIASLLASIEQGHPVLDASNIRLISNIADGADSIVVDQALARDWTLDLVLPFPCAHLACNVGPAAQNHDPRRNRARAIFELPGSHTDQGLADVAYERAGRIMLAQSDILIAVWDGGAARGRGGTPQIVAEAVALDIPVIHVDPARRHPPTLLWDGLIEHDLGQQTIESVPRGPIESLPRLLAGLLGVAPDAARTAPAETARRLSLAIAYPLLLALLGVRRIRRADFVRGPVARAPAGTPEAQSGTLDDRLERLLQPPFGVADRAASDAAQLFRNTYVVNYSFAALAVLLSLSGLALPPAFKPLLVAIEFFVIATILAITRAGRRAHWHSKWLDNRHLAERLRCLALSARLGELGLRVGADDGPSHADTVARGVARALGLPDVRVDSVYLASVRAALSAQIEEQVAYLGKEARQMHHLEHRLHRLGLLLFAGTAVACVVLLLFEAYVHLFNDHGAEPYAHAVVIGATICSAALPALGAAIYGIRMQGDFAGIARRSERLRHHLESLAIAVAQEDPTFDVLKRRIDRLAELLVSDVASWRQSFQARPLALPG